MSDRIRFLGGAAAGLFLAVAIVAAISLGTASLSSPTLVAGTASKTFSSSTTSTTSATTMSATVQAGTPSNLSSGGPAYSRPSSSTTTTTSAATSQTTSASHVPPSQTDNTSSSSTTAPATSNPGISIASLIQTLPAVAIALVLGIAVYQFSVRRVDRTDAVQRTH